MHRLFPALIAALVLLAATQQTALAGDDFLVPIDIGGKTYTLTVAVDSAGISVTTDSKLVTVGQIHAVEPRATPTDTADLDAQKATAVSVPYDDLFRNNEEHVGKKVRYVGAVVQVQENPCMLCEEPSYTLRIAVTEGMDGLWDDPIWVDYTGTERFLEDDIVTVWGVVEGLQQYTAVLGNQVTLPQIAALDIQLGEVATPQPEVTTPQPEVTTPQPAAATANNNANLRGGPGTGYAVVGATQAGDVLAITARDNSGDWLQLASGDWIAAFLVDNAPANADLPVAQEIPAPPTPAPTQPTTETSAQSSSTAPSGFVQIGQEIEGGGWRFKVSAIHKRKAVYFYDESHVAMGRYLIVVIDATKLQSGTDYFDRSIAPWVTDEPGNVFNRAGTASGYARWQYGGLSSIYTDVNPGNFVRMAFAVDLPDDTGRVLLSTDIGQWIDLGNFSAMQSEDR